MPVWDWTICTSKCLELYRSKKKTKKQQQTKQKSLGTSLMWVSSMPNDLVWTWAVPPRSIVPRSFPASASCIVAVWCCVGEWRVSHLLCPISRQPVQFCESAACLFFSWVFFLFLFFYFYFFSFGGEGVACIQKRAIWGWGLYVCVWMHLRVIYLKKGFLRGRPSTEDDKRCESKFWLKHGFSVLLFFFLTSRLSWVPSLLLCCIRILLLSVGQLVYIHPNKSDFLSVCVSLHFLRMCPGVTHQRRGQECQVSIKVH